MKIVNYQKQNLPLSKKRIIGSILLGFTVMAILYVILQAISSYIFVLHISRLNIAELKRLANNNNIDPTTQMLHLATGIIGGIIFFLGGLITGKMTKKKGWLYGGIVGLSWDVLVALAITTVIIIIAFFPSIFIRHYKIYNSSYEHVKNIELHKWISLLPMAFINITLPLTILGGWIGQKFQIKNRK